MTPLIVFAKAPRPGQVKTRLAPALGDEGAALLHRRLVAHTLRTARSANVGPVELCCAPDASDAFFLHCAQQYGVALTQQGDGDLGARMARALGRVLHGASQALLIGTDCPAMGGEYLHDAAAALTAGHDAVVGPAEDGGYVLIGTRLAEDALFERIQWGAADVMENTRARLRSLAWRWHELPTLWDVDRPDDLIRLRAAGIPGCAELLSD